MAVMIPDIDPMTIANNGERLFYEASAALPGDYTVLYSYKYRDAELSADQKCIREADFVLVHPALGYLVVEVKQGDILYNNGKWYQLWDGRDVPLRDPVEQAQSTMYAILQQYMKKAGKDRFPLKIKFGVAFPESTKLSGMLPDSLDRESIFLFQDMQILEQKILRLFGENRSPRRRDATDFLVSRVLAPSFKIYARLEEQIEMFNQRAKRVLTEEQERILAETVLDRRKVFLGAAGTGKTFLAMEKARMLAARRGRVMLTCYNKNLAAYFNEQLPPEVFSANFHDLCLRAAREKDPYITVPDEAVERNTFFTETLPTLAFDHFATLPEKEKYDGIIVDEGQDFREEWFSCLESALKEDGVFYVFADPHQAVFNPLTAMNLSRYPVSMHRLTRNLRNTEAINRWICSFLPRDEAPRGRLEGGLPITYFPWETPEEERNLIERELGRLVSQGLQPGRIVVLSPMSATKARWPDWQS